MTLRNGLKAPAITPTQLAAMTRFCRLESEHSHCSLLVSPKRPPSIVSLLVVVFIAVSSCFLPIQITTNNNNSRLIVSAHSASVVLGQQQLLADGATELAATTASNGANNVINSKQLLSNEQTNSVNNESAKSRAISSIFKAISSLQQPTTTTTTTTTVVQSLNDSLMPWNESIWWMLDKVADDKGGGDNYMSVPKQQLDEEVLVDNSEQADEDQEEQEDEVSDDDLDSLIVGDVGGPRNESTPTQLAESKAETSTPKREEEPITETLSNQQATSKPLNGANKTNGAIAANQQPLSQIALIDGNRKRRLGRAMAPILKELMPLEEDGTRRGDKESTLRQQVDDNTGNNSAEESVEVPDDGSQQGGLGGGSGGNQTCLADEYLATIMVDQALWNNLTLEERQQEFNNIVSAGALVLFDNNSTGQLSDNGTDDNNNNSNSEDTSASSPSSGLMSSSVESSANQTVNLIKVSQCVLKSSQMTKVITQIITPILFSIIIVVGLLGNVIVMLVILEDRKLERELTPTNLLILDLSLADLSFIILCIPFTGWDYAAGHWVFGSLWCKFNQYLIVATALSSIYTLVLMSCDRFMAIVYPIKCLNYRTSKNMLQAIVIKWIVILLIASPTAMMHGLVDSPLGPDYYNCRFLIDHYNPLHFQIIFFITSYLFPLILIFCLYLSLLNKLWFGQKPRGHKESHKMQESKKKVTWLVASIVIVFAACWFPIQIMLILMRLRKWEYTAPYVAIQVFAHTLGYMNSCVNPIVYAFASETFNQSFKKSWLGRLCTCCYSNSSHYYNNPTNGLNSNANTHNNNNNNNNNEHTTLGQIDIAGHMRSSVSGPTRHSARNSLQVGPTTSAANRNHFGVNQRNQSLNNIFKPQAGPIEGRAAVQRQQASSNEAAVVNQKGDSLEGQVAPQPLKLEPRDRPQVPPTQQASQQQHNHIVAHASTVAATKSPTAPHNETISNTSKLNEQQQQRNQIDKSLSVQQQQQRQQQLVPRQPTASPKVFNSLQKQQLVARMVPNQSDSNQVVVAHECEPRDKL